MSKVEDMQGQALKQDDGGGYTLNRLVDIALELTAEKDFDALMQKILLEAMEIYKCDAGPVYVKDGDYKSEPNDLPQVILLFIVSAVAFFVFQKTDFKISTAVAAVIIILSLAASYLAYNMGYVLHILWVPVGVFLLGYLPTHG